MSSDVELRASSHLFHMVTRLLLGGDGSQSLQPTAEEQRACATMTASGPLRWHFHGEVPFWNRRPLWSSRQQATTSRSLARILTGLGCSGLELSRLPSAAEWLALAEWGDHPVAPAPSPLRLIPLAESELQHHSPGWSAAAAILSLEQLRKPTGLPPARFRLVVRELVGQELTRPRSLLPYLFLPQVRPGKGAETMSAAALLLALGGQQRLPRQQLVHRATLALLSSAESESQAQHFLNCAWELVPPSPEALFADLLSLWNCALSNSRGVASREAELVLSAMELAGLLADQRTIRQALKALPEEHRNAFASVLGEPAMGTLLELPDGRWTLTCTAADGPRMHRPLLDANGIAIFDERLDWLGDDSLAASHELFGLSHGVNLVALLARARIG